ncbi:MAG: PilZ domain-containing protein [Gammaproteobacteria bacterium]|nr:PilZ domain-containing protein [Gammaproteobacteria bacterium]
MVNPLETMSVSADPVSWQLVRRIDEQRQHPRVELEIPVAFRNAHGQHCAARLCNLSADGLQVRCNVATAQIMHPLGGRIGGDSQPILQATLALPLGAGHETLSLGVRLQYLTVVDEEPRCMLGFSFLNLRPKARRIVEAFFNGRIDAYTHVA